MSGEEKLDLMTRLAWAARRGRLSRRDFMHYSLLAGVSAAAASSAWSTEVAAATPKKGGTLCVGLHPGTVDTALSAPFQANVSAGKLFTTARAAAQLLTVINGATPEQSGSVLAWDGSVVPP